MSRQMRQDQLDTVRRKLLKTSLAAGGVFVAGTLPYTRPTVKSFYGTRSAWAQATAITSAQYLGRLANVGSAFGTGQDEWTLDTTVANTTLTINVTITAGGPATPEIGLFAPGVPTTGTNLLTGSGGGTSGPFPVVVSASAVGTYTLAISDSLPNFSEVPFSYQLDVTADKPIVPGSQITNDGPETLLLTSPVR